MKKQEFTSAEMLDLLLDGYAVFWQVSEDKVTIEDLDLITRQFYKHGYDVATVIQGGIVTVFKKKRCLVNELY